MSEYHDDLPFQKLPQDIEAFLNSLMAQEYPERSTLESLVHPQMRKFLAEIGMDEAGLLDAIRNELNTFVSGLTTKTADMPYMVSPLQTALARIIASTILDTVVKSAGEKKGWTLDVGPDGNVYVGLHMRALYILISLGVTLAFAGIHRIGPKFLPGTADMPVMTSLLYQAVAETVDRGVATDIQRDALDAFHKAFPMRWDEE